jgi:ABC-type dipeptide/oligopeptide/nickel transport system permease subunit
LSGASPTSLPPLDINRASQAGHTPDGGDIGQMQSGWRLAAREFSHNKLAVIGLAVLVFFVLFCFIGPLLYRVNLNDTNIEITNLPPGPGHLLGTDDLGIDVLAELMKGGQSALEIGFLAAALGIGLGAIWGAISGLAGGVTDSVMMRVVDVFLSIPGLFIVLIVAVRYGASVLSLSLIIGAFTWLVPARLVRGEVLTLRVRDFVSAARTAGASRWRLINKHLIPNALGVIIVNVTFNVADAILLVAALGFLGFGLHYPSQDWGDMLSNGIQYMQDGYWWLVYPVGASIVLVVMACNLIGDALRDSLDVRLRRR